RRKRAADPPRPCRMTLETAMEQRTHRRTRRALLLAAATTSIAGRTAFAQDKYPSRPIEFIVPWGAGGGADQVARALGQLLEPILGVPLPIQIGRAACRDSVQ